MSEFIIYNTTQKIFFYPDGTWGNKIYMACLMEESEANEVLEQLAKPNTEEFVVIHERVWDVIET